tara:strand:+ start:229 stop:393 length:165 start_codon:yes stop_codon:yes gene_type:complete
MKEKMSEAIIQYIDNTDIKNIPDSIVVLIMSFERANEIQLKCLQKLLTRAGYDC